MADILSQEEINALLGGSSNTPSLRDALEKRGVPVGKSRSFPKFIAKFEGSDLPPQEREKRALDQLDKIIEGTTVSKGQRTYLRKLVRTKLAEILAREQREGEETEQTEDKKILTRDEIDALQAATDAAVTKGAEEQSDVRIITSYDFKHPARVNKDQLRTMENLHDNFARLLSSTFSGAAMRNARRGTSLCSSGSGRVGR